MNGIEKTISICKGHSNSDILLQLKEGIALKCMYLREGDQEIRKNDQLLNHTEIEICLFLSLIITKETAEQYSKCSLSELY